MKRIILCFILSIFIFGKTAYAKYVMEYKNTIAVIQIDTIIPKIEILKIEKTNKAHQNNTKIEKITIQIKITEKNVKENNLEKDKILIFIDEKQILPNVEIKQIFQQDEYAVYEMELSELNEFTIKEKMKIYIPKGTIKDLSGNESIENTIEIDNL